MRVRLDTDIVSFEHDALTPMFDLLIGIESMSRVGIVLDLRTKW